MSKDIFLLSGHVIKNFTEGKQGDLVVSVVNFLLLL